MIFLFDNFIYYPIYNFLIFVYNFFPIHDFGIAIIIVTVIIKALLIPVSKKQIQSQKKMQELQPKIKEIQQKYKNDKEKQSRALMEFYKENKTNPLSGCLPMIVQLIFLIAIYRVLFNISQNGLLIEGTGLYSFVHNPGQINHLFLGLIDLSSKIDIKNITLANFPHVLLVLAAAASQYFQSKMLMSKQALKKDSKAASSDFAQAMQTQMLYLGPILTLFIGIQFPAGLALYWLVSTVFMIVQQYYIAKEEEYQPAKTT